MLSNLMLPSLGVMIPFDPETSSGRLVKVWPTKTEFIILTGSGVNYVT